MVSNPNNDKITAVSWSGSRTAKYMQRKLEAKHMRLEELYKDACDFLSGSRKDIGFTWSMMDGRVRRARQWLKDNAIAIV